MAAPGRRHRVEPAVLDHSDAQRLAKKHDLIASTGSASWAGYHPNGAVAPDGPCDHGRRGARLIWRVRLTVTGFRWKENVLASSCLRTSKSSTFAGHSRCSRRRA